MSKPINWMNTFFNAMASLEPRMKLAMQADSCREGWLQAEMMMYASHQGIDVWTNIEPVLDAFGKKRSGSKFDLAAYDADNNATMVAEIKIVGPWFTGFTKCLFGKGRFDDFLAEGPEGRTFKSDDLLVRESGWGLLSDAARLLRHSAPERYLILVALDASEGGENLKGQKERHNYMMNMSFCPDSAKEETRKCDGFATRIWRL